MGIKMYQRNRTSGRPPRLEVSSKMFSYESERIVVVVSGFDDDADSTARRGEETVREPRAKSSANGTSSSFTFSFFSVCLTERVFGKIV